MNLLMIMEHMNGWCRFRRPLGAGIFCQAIKAKVGPEWRNARMSRFLAVFFIYSLRCAFVCLHANMYIEYFKYVNYVF